MTKKSKKNKRLSQQTFLLFFLCFYINTSWSQTFYLIDTLHTPDIDFPFDIRRNELDLATCDFVLNSEYGELIRQIAFANDFTISSLWRRETFYFSTFDDDRLENNRLTPSFFAVLGSVTAIEENTFFDPEPFNVAADYNNQLCILGQGVTLVDATDYTGSGLNQVYNLNYIEDLPPNIRPKGQMTLREGSFYYPSVNNELIQFKVRGDNSYVYRTVGSLPDTINYGGLFSIPHSCDSTTTYLIDRRPETGSTLYILSIPDLTLTQHCQLPQKSISAGIEGENVLPPCDFAFDLNALNDTTVHRYDTICSGSISLLDENLLLFTDLEFDSLVIENTNPLNGAAEWLEVSTTHPEVTIAGNQSNRILLESTGFAKGSYFLEVLQSLAYTQNAAAPILGIREVKVQLFHPFYDSLEASVFINVHAGSLVVEATVEQPSCFGFSDASITLLPSGGVAPLSVVWQDDNSTELIRDNLLAGDYPWQLNDAAGCVLSDTIFMFNPDTLSVSITSPQDTICADNGRLLSLVQGGTMPYRFAWSNNAADSIITQISAGQHTLTITDANDCEATAMHTLTAADTIFDNVLLESCQGQTLMVNGQVYTEDIVFQELLTTAEGCDALVDYQLVFWDTFYTAHSHTLCFGDMIEINGMNFSTDTIVSFTEQSVQGCDSTHQYNIHIRPDNIQSSTANICQGESYDFRGQILTQTGLYADTLATSNGCDSIIQLQLNIHEPQPSIQTQGRLCAGGSMRLSTNNFVDYLWNTGASTPAITIDAHGAYSLLVYDEYGCEGTASIQIQDTTLQLVYEVRQPLCPEEGGGVLFNDFLGGSPPYSISPSGTLIDTLSEISDLSAGQHTFTIQDADGCVAELEVNIENALALEVVLPDLSPIVLGESIVLAPEPSFSPTSVLWSPDIDLSCNDCLTPFASPKETMTYQVQLQNGEGCLWEGSIMVVVKRNGLYIPNAFSPNDDGKNDFFTVYPSASVQSVNNIEIFDRWGALVFQSNPMNPIWDGMIGSQKAAQGVYLYQIEWIDWNNEVVIEKGEVVLLR